MTYILASFTLGVVAWILGVITGMCFGIEVEKKRKAQVNLSFSHCQINNKEPETTRLKGHSK